MFILIIIKVLGIFKIKKSFMVKIFTQVTDELGITSKCVIAVCCIKGDQKQFALKGH